MSRPALVKLETRAEAPHALVPQSSAPSRQRHRNERAVMLCDRVIEVVSILFNTPTSEIRRNGRTDPGAARMRHIAMYVAHVALRLPMKDVATGFARDRTTVVHACHLIEDMRDDIDFDRIVVTAERIVMATLTDWA